MQLTEDVAALERYRVLDAKAPRLDMSEWHELQNLWKQLCPTLLRLFPVRTYGEIVIRWDDPITPERLVACGFKVEQVVSWIANETYQLTLYPSGLWEATHLPFCIHEKVYPTPRNMLDAWQLMERCGIEEGGK